MYDISRLGLGAMGMSVYKNPEKSEKTVRTAFDLGINLNTGEFYNAGESKMILGKALKGVDRDSYFLSVKFGVLPSPEGGIYGLDVKPYNIKGHLTYSLRRLGLDYVDLYKYTVKRQNAPKRLLIKMLKGESPMAHHEERFATNVAERFFISKITAKNQKCLKSIMNMF